MRGHAKSEKHHEMLTAGKSGSLSLLPVDEKLGGVGTACNEVRGSC